MKDYYLKTKKSLFEAFARAQKDGNFDDFLKLVLTRKEYEEIIRRWYVLKELDKKRAQRDIADDLGLGLATVSRGQRAYWQAEKEVRKYLKDK